MFSLEDDPPSGQDAVRSDDEEQVPAQGPGIAFALSAAGVIEIAPQGLARITDEAAIGVLRGVVAETLGELSAALAGTNAHPWVAVAAERYAVAIDANPMSIDLVYSLGVRLENVRARLDAEVRSGDLPPMAATAAEALDSVLALHGPLVLSTERGRELAELAHEYARGQAATEEYRTAARNLAAAAADAPGLVAVDAAALLVAVNGPGEEASLGRSRQVAHSANRNFLAAIARTALGAVATTMVGSVAVATDPGLVAVDTMTTAANLAWHFLAAHATEYGAS